MTTARRKTDKSPEVRTWVFEEMAGVSSIGRASAELWSAKSLYRKAEVSSKGFKILS